MSVRIEFIDGPLPPLAPQPGAAAGATLHFEGVIRPLEQDRPLLAMTYEAYRPMADTMLRDLAEEISRHFAIDDVFVQHSVGSVLAGERSFRLVITSPHRAPALQAMTMFIDRMKQDVPIWKRPQFADAPEACS